MESCAAEVRRSIDLIFNYIIFFPISRLLSASHHSTESKRISNFFTLAFRFRFCLFIWDLFHPNVNEEGRHATSSEDPPEVLPLYDYSDYDNDSDIHIFQSRSFEQTTCPRHIRNEFLNDGRRWPGANVL